MKRLAPILAIILAGCTTTPPVAPVPTNAPPVAAMKPQPPMPMVKATVKLSAPLFVQPPPAVITNIVPLVFSLPSYFGLAHWGIDETHDFPPFTASTQWSNILTGPWPSRQGIQPKGQVWTASNTVAMTVSWTSTNGVGFYRIWSSYF